MKNVYLFFVFLVNSGLLFAQAPDIEWEKTYGGSDYDITYTVEMTSDGGYIMAGYTNSKDGDVTGIIGDNDYWIVKVDSAGALEWQQVLGGQYNDGARQVRQLSDGNYITGGWRTYAKAGGNIDFWLVKLGSSGEVLWEKNLGGSGRDELFSLKQTTDGGFVMAGWTASDDGDISGYHGSNDGWVVKTDAEANIEYQRALGGSGLDHLESIIQTADGGYIVAGRTRSIDGDISHYSGNYDGWLVKLDNTLNIEWSTTYGSTGWDEFTCVRQTTDGGYIAGGTSIQKFWIVKTNASGVLEWERKVGGTGEDEGHAVRQLADGGYIMAGWVYSNNGDVSGNHGFRDWWVVRFDQDGALLWQKAIGSEGFDDAYDIEQTPDGGYIVAGYTNDQSGDVSYHRSSPDYWLVKLKPDPVASGIPTTELPGFDIYPNPAKTSIHLIKAPKKFEYSIVDLLGRIHKTGSNEQSIEIDNLTEGMFLLILDHEHGKTVRKFIKQ